MTDRIDRNERDLNLDDSAHSASREAGREAERLDAERADSDSGEKTAASAVGGVGGAAAGAAVGTVVAGPIGTAIGAIAGAIGGWWAGQASTVATDFKDVDDDRYRGDYDASESRLADRRYEDVRPAYQLGHIARRNPEYRGRAFDEIESDLQKGWTEDLRSRHGNWSQVRAHVRSAYSHNPDLEPETVSERTVIRASETARDRLAGGRGGLTRDDTTGY